MAIENGNVHASPSWFVDPGGSDILAWVAIVFLALVLYGIVTLYAAFDRWAEHKSKGTPLARTIPTLLTIALLYELFPLDHFNILLPLSAILISLMADWSRFHSFGGAPSEHETDVLIINPDQHPPGGDDHDRSSNAQGAKNA